MADGTGGGGSSGESGGSIAGYGQVAADVFGFLGNMLAQDASTKSAQSDMAELDINAGLAADAAGDALLRGNVEAGKLRLRASQMVSEQQLAYQAGGVDPTTGTPATNAEYTSAVGELDAQTAANNAAREAWGYKQQQAGFQRKRQNRLEQWQAQNTEYNLNQMSMIAKFGFDSAAASGSGGGG